MRIPKLPPIHVMREHVDGEVCAVLAFCFRVGRRRCYDPKNRCTVIRPALFGVSVFTLVSVTDGAHWQWLKIGHARLLDKLGPSRRLPFVGLCHELAGWGDFV